MSDRIFGLFGLALAAFYFWATSIIPDSFMIDVVGPRTFPYIVGTVLTICSLYILLRPDAEPDWPNLTNFIEVIFATAVMFLYGWALSKVGFVIATVFATAYLSWRLGTKPLSSLVTGIATSAGIYLVFHLILGLSLAKGPLGF
ncbi:tripartite tricarboxylate transporter TctB family protein [uncultured Desulfuromusa sp.]|uniref:tripartite tricarboxylate transporter TctB family protein n=1 Tax=uncultured Desulfuromusa sp. TaxID=219183 RepID=UPI002AA6692D|nr:tripartite tricarboxylate transporter TctB family protein [uncultured Desulfuromusa sp.]